MWNEGFGPLELFLLFAGMFLIIAMMSAQSLTVVMLIAIAVVSFFMMSGLTKIVKKKSPENSEKCTLER